jgi:HSP20 family protein
MTNGTPFVSPISPATMNGPNNPYLVDSVNRVFEELTRSWDADGRPWTPRCDFWETATSYTIRCCVPGCSKSDCKIACTATSITISGCCNMPSCPTNCNCYTCECQTGNFARCFTLPNAINTSSVKASCKNGVLTVTCKKSSQHKPTTVKVG